MFVQKRLRGLRDLRDLRDETRSKGSIEMIRQAIVALGVILFLSVATLAVAQTALGTLRGVVLDEQGAVLPGVTITVRQVDTNTLQTVLSGAEGRYFLPNLRPGRYEVTSELSGFANAKQALELRVGQDLTLNFTMKVGGLSEQVDVVARSVAVETQSTLSTVITNKQIDDLPTVTRDFSALATISPGATTSTATGTGQGTGVSISGQRPFTNGIVVDGANNQMQFYGRQANDFPQDWIQEFQVLTNSFSAEYGQAAGGMLNVITRSGSNTASARVYGFFRDNTFDRPPFSGRYDADKQPIFLDTTPPFDQQRYGGFAGGPIVKNRVFYFAGLERLNNTSSEVLGISDYWRQTVADTVIATGQRQTVGMVKVDVDFNEKNRGYFRYTDDYKRFPNVGGTSPGSSAPLETLETRQTFGGPLWNVMGNWTSALSNRAFNELRVSYGVNKPWILANIAGGLGGSDLLAAAGYTPTTGNPTGKFARMTFPGASFGATSFTGLEGEGNLFVVDNFSFVRGRHQFKAGGVLARQQMYMDVEAAHVGIWGFTQDRRFDANDPASFPSSFSGNMGSGLANPVVWNPSAYLQDTWQATNNLTFNLGVRYDVDLTPTSVNPYVDPYNQRVVARLGGAPPLRKSTADKNNVSPRLGVVWVPSADRRTTLRSSFGFYYDQNHWNFTDIYLNETLLALRRITLNANTQGGNPFWTPANTAVGIAQMRAFLARSFPAYPDMSGLPFPQETILGVQPNYTIPYSSNFAIGMTREFGPRISARADYVRTRTYDANIGGDSNWTRNADGTFTRRDTRYANITLVGNGGSIWYNALESRLEYRPAPSSRAGVSYTLSKTRSNTGVGLSTGGTTNPFDLNEDLGPDDNDRRHNLVFDASYLMPRIDVQVAGISTSRSALPYSVSTSFQLDSDPFADRPEPRGSRRGAPEKTTDVRVSKIFRFGRNHSVTAFWEMFNVFDVDNWLRYQGSLQSTSFGLALTEGPKRRQQLGFRVDF
jgi:outer membrane receptor protein involved in Fe transport